MRQLFGILLVSFAFAATPTLGSTPSEDSCDQIVYAGPPDFPPWSWQDANGEYRGVGTQLLVEVSKRIGIDTSPVDTASWHRAYKLADAGNVDFLTAMTWNEDDSTSFTYPADLYYAFEEIAIIELADGKAPDAKTSIEDIRTMSGVTAETARFGNTFDRIANEQLDLSRISSVDKAFELLLIHKRFDYMLFNRYAAVLHAERLGVDDMMMITNNNLASEPVYISMSQQSPCWVILNEMTRIAHEIYDEALIDVFLEKAVNEWRTFPNVM